MRTFQFSSGSTAVVEREPNVEPEQDLAGAVPTTRRSRRPRRRARRRLIGLLLVILVLVVAYLPLDLLAQHEAERLATSVLRHRSGAHQVHVSVDEWPFLYDLLVHQSIERAAVQLAEVPVGDVAVTQVTVVGKDLSFSASKALARRFAVTGGAADVTARLGVAMLAKVIGHPLELSPENLARVEIATRWFEARAALTSSQTLVLTVPGQHALTVAFSGSSLLTACPIRLTTTRAAAILRCTVSPVNQELLDRLASRQALPTTTETG